MLTLPQSRLALEQLFGRQAIADLPVLREALQTVSRMSVFRRLSAIGYYSSYSHNGRFYTLKDIPRFDADGLWRHQQVYFSSHGSLKATVVALVEASDAGRTHQELQDQLHVRVHNTLLDMVNQGRMARQRWAAQYLYVSIHAERARQQFELRRQQGEVEPVREPAAWAVIEVLLELLHNMPVCPEAKDIATRLSDRGVAVPVSQIEAIFGRYGLKKTLSSPSGSSPP